MLAKHEDISILHRILRSQGDELAEWLKRIRMTESSPVQADFVHASDYAKVIIIIIFLSVDHDLVDQGSAYNNNQ